MDSARYRETEHQELFVRQADLRRPLPLHIPSALHRLRYFLCLRVPEAVVAELAQTSARIQVGGLRPDDVTVRWGDGLDGQPAVLPSRVPGLAWVLLGCARLSRGDGLITFAGLPPELTSADLLLCTWPRFIASGQADDWLRCQDDPAWCPGGVPLGGIGTGKVELGRDGRFRNFSGNNNQDAPFEEPDGLDHAFLALGSDGAEVALATRAIAGLRPAQKLRADLRFPQATLTADDAFPGLAVEVTASGCLAPGDVRASAIPGFLLRWRLRNHGGSARRVACRLGWPNLIGRGGGIGRAETGTGTADGSYHSWDAPGGQRAEAVAGQGWSGLRYRNQPTSGHPPNADGEHLLAVLGAGHADAHATRGSVRAEVVVEPGAEAEVWMAVVWAMPQAHDLHGVDRGLAWSAHWADGAAILDHLAARRGEMIADAGALAEMLAQGDLPDWLRDRLSNANYPLVTNSVLYRDGRFSINEGPTEMGGCYGTLDQRLAAHPATLLLQPGLHREELGRFAALQAPDGGMNHDFGSGHLEKNVQPMDWPDLTCAFILQAARQAWHVGDAAWEREQWPRVRLALERHAVWADAGNGVAQIGDGLGTSYDGYHYHGTTPYIATLWQAALAVARRWAQRVGEAAILPRIDRWAAAAQQRLEADLWNGSFYRCHAASDGRINQRSHAGMLAGAWFARQLAGVDILPAQRLASCAEALFALNLDPRFGAPPDEVAADGSSWTEFGWMPYVEGFALAPLAALAPQRLLPAWRRTVAAMDGGGAHPCDTRLMYQPISGAPSWGAYYMTAPASWLVYEALLGFACEPLDGALRLAPPTDGRWPIVHPRFWGLAWRSGDECSLRIDRCLGEAVELQWLEAPAGLRLAIDGRELERQPHSQLYDRFRLPAPLRLVPGATLAWRVAG